MFFTFYVQLYTSIVNDYSWGTAGVKQGVALLDVTVLARRTVSAARLPTRPDRLPAALQTTTDV